MRVVVIGDDGVGKSTFIACLFKNRFIDDIEDVLPPLFFPRPNGQVVTVIDTSPRQDAQASLLAEIRQANCILLMFSDAYTMERVNLFWMPFLRTSGVNKPVVLCQGRQDSIDGDGDADGVAEDVQLIMQEYKEIVCFVKNSARQRTNVSETFYLCQQAVLFPLPPIYDAKDMCLKPLAREALSRIFFLTDEQQTGRLSRAAFQRIQKQVFHTQLSKEEYEVIIRNLDGFRRPEPLVIGDELTLAGFLALIELYCTQGRQDTVWSILRYYHYTDSLSVDSAYLYPDVTVPEHAHVELSPDGYEFLVDLFTRFDKDNDGGLNPDELANVFCPTPGLPLFWTESRVPLCTLRTDAGYLSLQGWLAQWSMYVYLDYTNALAYLALLGFGSRGGAPDAPLRSALKVTKSARKRNPHSRMYRSSVLKDRQVFNCFVIGAPGAGKSSLLAAYLNVAEATSMVVNTVELPGGTQCYLILREGDSSLLSNAIDLESCDVVCLCYDSSDPDSFAFLESLLNENEHLRDMPLVFAALKADLDRVEQRSLLQPDDYTNSLGLSEPMHLSTAWQSSLDALFSRLLEVAKHPGRGTILPTKETQQSNWLLEIGIGSAAVALSAAAYYLMRRRR